MNPATREQYRQQYLAAMGISSWLPVKPLPGAAPSPRWTWGRAAPDETGRDDQPRAVSRVATAEPGPREGRAAAAAIQQLLAQPSSRAPEASPTPPIQPVDAPGTELKDPQPPSEARAEPVPQADPTEQAEPPRFRLAFVAFEDCMVVNELPQDVLQGMSAEHQLLLSRILASIGLGQGEPQTRLLAWPVVNSPNVDQGPEVARAGVNNQINRLQRSAQQPLLLLGEQAGRYALKEAVANGTERIEDRPVLSGPSLNQLMRVPGLKRELWLQLLAFRRLLDGESSACAPDSP